MTIRLEIHDDVAEIALDAPDRLNALNPQDIADLSAAYTDAVGARALVLRGEGRAFCAGRDIAGVDPRTDDVLGYLNKLPTGLFDATYPPAAAAARSASARKVRTA